MTLGGGAVSSSQGSPIRDFGLSFGVSAAIIGAALVFLSGRYPDVVWPAELGAALAVAGLAAVAGALLSGRVLRRTALVVEVIGAVDASSLTYAAIAGAAY